MTKLMIQIAYQCEDEEFELAAKREMKTCHKVGSYSESEILGLSSMEFNSHCCFNSPLSRILQAQIRKQLNIGWGQGWIMANEEKTAAKGWKSDISMSHQQRSITINKLKPRVFGNSEEPN